MAGNAVEMEQQKMRVMTVVFMAMVGVLFPR